MAGCGLTEIYERSELCGEQHLSTTPSLWYARTPTNRNTAQSSANYCQESSLIEHIDISMFPSLCLCNNTCTMDSMCCTKPSTTHWSSVVNVWVLFGNHNFTQCVQTEFITCLLHEFTNLLLNQSRVYLSHIFVFLLAQYTPNSSALVWPIYSMLNQTSIGLIMLSVLFSCGPHTVTF